MKMKYRIYYQRGNERYDATGELEEKDVQADCMYDALMCLPAYARVASIFEVTPNGKLNRV